MPSFDASIDYLELLGLNLSDGTRFSAEQLKQTIRAKRKEWTAQAVNPLYQQQARRSLDIIRGFEKLLSRPEALADYLKQLTQLHSWKRQQVEREIGNLVRAAASSRGYLTTRQRELLAEQLSDEPVSAEVIDSVIERLGIELRSPDRLVTGSSGTSLRATGARQDSARPIDKLAENTRRLFVLRTAGPAGLRTHRGDSIPGRTSVFKMVSRAPEDNRGRCLGKKSAGVPDLAEGRRVSRTVQQRPVQSSN